MLGGRRGPASLLLRRCLISSLRLGGRDIVPSSSAAAGSVADGPGRGQVGNAAKCEVLELLQEIFSALRGRIHHLLQAELDLGEGDRLFFAGSGHEMLA